MSCLSGPLARETPPGTTNPWRLSDAVAHQFLEQVLEMDVTWDYDPERVVGRVSSASWRDGEPWLTVDLNDSAPVLLGPGAPQVHLGPQFVVEAGVRDAAGELEVKRARLLKIGLIADPNYREGELQRCRACGCVDEMACTAAVLAGEKSTRITCAWAEPDLCTACAGLEGVKRPDPLLPRHKRPGGYPPEFPLTDAVRAQLATLGISETDLSGAPVWKHPRRELTDAYAAGWAARDAL